MPRALVRNPPDNEFDTCKGQFVTSRVTVLSEGDLWIVVGNRRLASGRGESRLCKEAVT